MGRRTRIQGWQFAAAALLISASIIAPATAEAAFAGPNGRIFFGAAGDVWSISADGTALTNLTDVSGGPGSGSDPSVSANGLVAFVVGAGPSAEIWTMRSDGSNAQRVTANAARDAMPAISEDGVRIAFVTDRAGGDADLWTMAADGSGTQPLLTAAGDEEDPQFAPDGLNIVVATHIAANLDVGHVPASGGPYPGATPITFKPGDETAPALQPDQVRLAYTRGGDIWTAYYNGTDEFPLATSPLIESDPAFSPDGTRVAYATPAGLVVADAGGLNAQTVATPGAPADTDWAVGAAIDTAAPQTEITKAPRRRSGRTRARLRFESSEPGSTFLCRLDLGRVQICDSPQTYRDLEPGPYRFRVSAVDAAGNRDPSPARVRFRVLARRR